MKKQTILMGFTALIIILSLTGFKNPILPSDYWLEFILNHFQKYISLYHQNKVYLQTDKNEYETGETIYYKAYVLNSAEKKSETLVKNLYVEIIAPNKSVFMNRLLKINNGLAQGDFPVLDTVYSGMYMMRAYTENMKNSGKDYLFNKEIKISHPKNAYYNKEFHKKAKKIIKQEEQIDLQFFPEGGDMIDKIGARVAFKAINQYGNSVDVEGKIYSGKNQYICDFKSSHLGMGLIEFTPIFKQKYYAIINREKKKKIKAELPEVLQFGYTMKIEKIENNYRTTINTNKPLGDDPVAKTVYLIAQSGGKIYSSEKYALEKGQLTVNLAKNIFPSGVVQFTLFDGQGKPQCERLIFVNQDDFIDIQTNLDKSQFSKREKIEFDVLLPDMKSGLVMPNLAISVRQKSDFVSNNSDIRSYMLLQSDLKGNVENPSYYFSNKPEVDKHLDYLMMTQGWRKFLWKDILADSIKKPKFQIEYDLTLTGKITKYFFGIPVKNAKVTMTLLNQFNDVFETKSAKKGYFEFKGLDYSDTMDVLIEVRTAFNRKNVLILVDEPEDVGNDFFPFKDFYLDTLRKKHKIKYEKYVEEPKDPNVPEDFKIHDYADNVVKFDDKMVSGGRSVMDILKSRVPGMQVSNNSSSLRGSTGSSLGSDPLYLLDGVPVDFQTIESVNVNDVNYVDILKGPSAVIYGMRGYNGVVAVYTKKGHYMKRGEIRFKMLGYHTPKKFYSPKYQTKENIIDYVDNRKTIFWSPSVTPNENGRAHIEFYHSDIPGDFEIVIEGMDQNGKVGSYLAEYNVK